MRALHSAAGALGLLLLAAASPAQDLDPRAYVNVPVGGTFAIAGFAVSHGAVVTDPSLPLTDINATVETPSIGLARSFGLFGKTAQAFAGLPYSFAQLSGKFVGEARETTREGFSDMRLRLSVLLRGAPAVSVAEFAKAPRRTILGTSLSVIAPTGQVFPDKLINLGTNRWSFKPEFAVSQPLGQRWLLDVYAGVWLFTANDSFYPGTALRTQDPMGVLQAHVSYNFTRRLWAAFDATSLRRRPDGRRGDRRRQPPVQLPDRSDARVSGRTQSLHQARGEHGRRRQVRRRLQHVFDRLADRLAPAPQTRGPGACQMTGVT